MTHLFHTVDVFLRYTDMFLFWQKVRRKCLSFLHFSFLKWHHYLFLLCPPISPMSRRWLRSCPSSTSRSCRPCWSRWPPTWSPPPSSPSTRWPSTPCSSASCRSGPIVTQSRPSKHPWMTFNNHDWILIMMDIVGSSNVKKTLNVSDFFAAMKSTINFKQEIRSQHK